VPNPDLGLEDHNGELWESRSYDMMQDVGMINFLEWREISSFFVCFFLFVSFLTGYGYSTVIWLEGLALRGAKFW